MAADGDTLSSADSISQSILTSFSREITERVLKSSTLNSAEDIRKAVETEYQQLPPGSARYLELRLKRLIKGDDFVTEVAERGFWLFYNKIFETAKDTDLKNLNKYDIHFFYNVWNKWHELAYREQGRYRREAAQHVNACPAPQIHDSLKILSAQSADAIANAAEDRLGVRGICGGLEQHVLDDFSLKSLEECVEAEMRSMERLKQKLSSSKADELVYWTKKVNILLTQKNCSTLKVAFFGSTGSGKSTLINTILGERLLPESSSGACTPFSIEIGFDSAPGSTHQIRLIVHFVDKESWTQELETFFSTLKHVDGRKDSYGDDDDDDDNFKSMRDKLQILCPQFTTSQLSQMCADDIVELENVSGRLGESTTQTFPSTKAAYDAIDELIRPQEKSKPAADTVALPRLWPLVKYIRVETKSDTLRHGITIFDLPGTLDANKARSMVAERQMKECSAIYIVAPSIRVADDTGANDLLLRAFEDQFHLDKMSLSIVATKSDDIQAPSRVAKDYGVRDDLDSVRRERQILKARIETLTEKQRDLEVKGQAVEDDIQAPKYLIAQYEKLKRNIEQGAPQPRSALLGVGQKRKRELLDDNDSECPHNTHIEIPVASHEDLLRTVSELDELVQIDTVMAEFNKKSAAATRLANEISKGEREIQDLETQVSANVLKPWQVCIQARNQKNQKAARDLYVRALRQFEEAGSGQHDRTAKVSNMTEDEINACAADLRFFAVSAKAFDNLNRREGGMMNGEAEDDGYQEEEEEKEDSKSLKSFVRLDQTGIPALVRNCVEQAEIKRRTHAERLLKRTWKIKNGLHLSASGTSFGDHVTKQSLEEAKANFDETFESVSEGVQKLANKSNELIINELKRKVLRKNSAAQERARRQAHQITQKFNNSMKSHRTYKAIMVRAGAFITHEGLRYDLNQDLLRPFTDVMGPPWRRFFGERLPEIITNHQACCYNLVSQMLDAIAVDAEELGCPRKRIDLIREQRETYANAFQDASNAYQQSLQFGQREARQSSRNTVQQALDKAYHNAAAIKGRNSFVNMKATLLAQVVAAQATVFAGTGSELRKEVDKFCKESSQRYADEISEILKTMYRDCSSVFTMSKTRMSQAELDLRSEIIDMLEEDQTRGGEDESKQVREMLQAALASRDITALE